MTTPLTSSIDSEDLTTFYSDLHHARKVVVITGAGISVASGIPPFRKSQDAVWEKTITEKGTWHYFQSHPVESLKWYLERFSGIDDKLPNPSHYAIRDLEHWCQQNNKSFQLVTQNVDGLHGQAGSNHFIEIHGQHHFSRCINPTCTQAAPQGKINNKALDFKTFLMNPSISTIPRCPLCNHLIRPHILWFDETYDSHEDYQYEKAIQSFLEADLFLAIGTSFSVGITESALYFSAQTKSTFWALDLEIDPQVPIDDWLVGKSEKILPALIKGLP